MRRSPPHALIALTLACAACDEGPPPDEFDATWEYTNLTGGTRPFLLDGEMQGGCVEAKRLTSDFYQQYIVEQVSLGGNGCFPDGAALDFVSSDSSISNRTTGGWADVEPDPAINEGTCIVDWSFDNAVLQDLACSDPGCALGDWYVGVYPVGDPDFETCATYDDAFLHLWFVLVDSKGIESTAADCSPGSGRFRLAPTGFEDINQDGDGRRTYVPVKTSGTGTLTNRARVTAIDLVSDGGYPLRVLKAGAGAHFTAADLLVDPNVKTYALWGDHTFQPGDIRGTPVFLHPPFPETVVVAPEVDMTWDCGGTVDARTYTAGYQVNSSVLGCGGSQKLVVRYDGSEVRLEAYGNPIVYAHGPVGANGSFSISRGGITVNGAVLSVNQNAMSLRLDSVTDGTLSYCTPGTYTLAPE